MKFGQLGRQLLLGSVPSAPLGSLKQVERAGKLRVSEERRAFPCCPQTRELDRPRPTRRD